MRAIDAEEGKIWVTALLAVLAFLGVAVYALLRLTDRYQLLPLYVDSLSALSAAAAFFASLKMLLKHAITPGGYRRSPQLYLAAGLGTWLVAESMQLLLPAGLDRVGGLTIGEILWLIGCAYTAVGIVKCLGPFRAARRSAGLKPGNYALLLPLLGVLLSSIALARTSTAIRREWSMAALLDLLSYVLASILLIASLEGIAVFSVGRLGRGLMVFSVGSTLLAVNHVACLALGGSVPGSMLDLSHAISYVVLAVGLLMQGREPKVV